MTILEGGASLPFMTVTEVIDEIRALSSQERARVLELLLKLEASSGSDPAFEEALEQVMKSHAELMQKLVQ